jgi:hydrogenase expression/formation protein HypC
MCLAIPAQVVTIDASGENATVAIDQIQVEVSLALVEDVVVGDYVLVHVGYALQKLSEEEAMKTLELFVEAGLTA